MRLGQAHAAPNACDDVAAGNPGMHGSFSRPEAPLLVPTPAALCSAAGSDTHADCCGTPVGAGLVERAALPVPSPAPALDPDMLAQPPALRAAACTAVPDGAALPEATAAAAPPEAQPPAARPAAVL